MNFLWVPHQTTLFDSILMLSRISAINKNLDQAKELLIKAVEIQPKNITAIHNLGTCYKELGQLEEAKNYYNKALEIDPRHTNSNYNLGVIFYQLKDLKKAKSYLKKTVDLQKNYGIALYDKGNWEMDGGNVPDLPSGQTQHPPFGRYRTCKGYRKELQ